MSTGLEVRDDGAVSPTAGYKRKRLEYDGAGLVTTQADKRTKVEEDMGSDTTVSTVLAGDKRLLENEGCSTGLVTSQARKRTKVQEGTRSS